MSATSGPLDGRVALVTGGASGIGRAIARELAARECLIGEPELPAGEIVTTGTLTQAMPLQPGQRWEHGLSASIELKPVQLRIR